MEATATTFPLDMGHVLSHPAECVVCRRRVSARTIDRGQATMIRVDTTGNQTEDPNGYRVVVGPECGTRLAA